MKTAIIGVGRMGRRHIHIVRQAGLELVGVFDVHPDSLKLAQEEYALAHHQLFDDLERLYSEAKPECLVIATTADSHCALTCMAAERGAKYILVEKPMAVSLEECDRMIETCRRYGVRLAVNHQMRFLEQYTVPKQMLAAGEYGNLTSMTVVAGNCGFAMNGTHYLEAFRFVAEEDLVEVAAWFSPEVVPNPRGSQFQDHAGSIRAVTASGKRLYLEIGADQGHGIYTIYACRNGMITLNDLTGDMQSTIREEQYRDLPTTRYAMPAVNTHRKIQPAGGLEAIGILLKALLNDESNVSGEDGRRVVELLIAAYQSAEQGSVPVRVDDKLDRSRIFPWA
jgi:predicted dehydrogenase